jgi:Putative Ig domain
MFVRKMLFGVLTFFALVQSQSAFATATFISNHSALTVTANVAKTVNLTTLLSSPGTGNLTWTFDTVLPAPTWAVLNSAASTLTITAPPTAIGSVAFDLVVTDGTEQGARTEIDLTVLGPPVWANTNVDLGIQTDGVQWSFDLKTVVKDPAGNPITFTGSNLPTWMAISSNGILSGTPPVSADGNYSGIQLTATSLGGTSNATAFGTVVHIVKPPQWMTNPITLTNATEFSAYSVNLNQYVLTFDPPTLAFTMVSGPSWLQVSSSGTLFGTPNGSNLNGGNPATITVSFIATIAGTAYPAQTATFNLSVTQVNVPPVWVSSNITLPDAWTLVAYSQTLANSASDANANDTLTFSILSGPSWLKMSSTGALSGTPQNADVGTETWQVQVADQNGLTATATLTIKVNQSIQPPTWSTVTLPDAKQGVAYSQSLTSFVTNPQNAPLTFSMTSGPSWVSVSPSGILSGTAPVANIGVNSITVQVSNSAGSASTTILLNVDKVNHPPQWTINPITLTTKEYQPMSISIAPYATEQDVGDTLTFQLLDGPTWASLSSTGTFTGTPGAGQVGTNTFTVRVLNNFNQPAVPDATVQINVTYVPVAPVWALNPIALPDAKERTPYSQNIASDVADADPSDKITFSLVSGPSWVTVSPTGTISGTPQRVNDGLNTLTVRATEANGGLFSDVTVTINVDFVPLPVYWRQNPILMTNAFENNAYVFSLAPYAVGDTGTTLTFSLVSGPAWMTVAANGTVTGTPGVKDIGPFTPAPVFSVTDGNTSAQASGTGTVIQVFLPPVIAQIPAVTVKERDDVTLDLTKYVTDPQGLPLTYTLPAGSPSFLTLSSTGQLEMKPVHSDIGNYTVSFHVSDGQLSSDGTINIAVIRNPRPPVWLQNPISITAKTNEPYTGSIASNAQDLDGYPITFKLVDGPTWFQVSSTGALSGTPLNADLGNETAHAQVCNDLLCATVPLTININVQPGINTITVQVDTPVPGASVENLWIIDNSKHCNQLMDALRRDIHLYFGALKTANLHFSDVYLSSDAHWMDGTPIRNNNDVILWSDKDVNPTQEFLERLKNGFSHPSGLCHNCFNSPIWSMFRFYDKVPSMTDIYHNGYMMPNVPMDAMILTQQRDHYEAFAKGTPQASWTATDYAKNFISFHTAQMKPYRVSTIAPACPRLVTEQPTSAGPENAYQVLTKATQGTYYPVENCGFNLQTVLADYAAKVIFRANVTAKTTIALTPPPIDLTSIKVSIGGTSIPGNTGSSTDKWYFDSATNSVVFRWYLIDLSTIKPGQMISISYRVS